MLLMETLATLTHENIMYATPMVAAIIASFDTNMTNSAILVRTATRTMFFNRDGNSVSEEYHYQQGYD